MKGTANFDLEPYNFLVLENFNQKENHTNALEG
jgi:hypothetical protein